MSNITLGDSRNPSSYPKEKFHLTITSPPYFVGKKYEEDYSFDDYRCLLKDVFYETAKHTVDGGKIAINIADIAAFSKVSHRVEESDQILPEITRNLKDNDCHLLARYIWHKDDPWVNSQHVCYHDKIPSTYVRALPNWEYIWVYYKGDSPKREDIGLSVYDTISKEDWKNWVSAVWKIDSVRANNDHAAKFPEELARRLMLLYSIEGDTIFDPFMGSGTTAVVSHKNNRKFAGIERDPKYHALCMENIDIAQSQQGIEFTYTAPDRYKQTKLY